MILYSIRALKMPVKYLYLSLISEHMAQGSKQSILKELLSRIDSGEFKYERREKKPINWSLYDQAQISEINEILIFFANIVDEAVRELNLEERYEKELKKPGRPPIFPGDLAKSILIQQYFHTPNRVSIGLVELFKEKMGIRSSFSYKSIERSYENRFVQEILSWIFIATQLPFVEKETRFSTDGTGIAISMKYNYEYEKYGNTGSEKKLDQFEQAIITIGSTYQIISDFIITDNPYAGEAPYLRQSVENVSHIYQNIELWSADAGYNSRENANAIACVGGKARIYPKKNDTFLAKGSPEWKNNHNDFIEDPQTWLRDYHERSLSESVNSAFLRMYPIPLARRLRNRRWVEAFTRACGYNVKRIIYLNFLKEIQFEWNDS